MPGGYVPLHLRHAALPGIQAGVERRPDMRDLIGERAERLAYLNCAMDRASFDRAWSKTGDRYAILDRLTGAEVSLSREDFDDLCRIHLYDWLEQVPRSQEWGYRRQAYRGMAARLGEPARQAYERVFAAEAAAAEGAQIVRDSTVRWTLFLVPPCSCAAAPCPPARP